MSCEKKCCQKRRHRIIWRISYSALGAFIGLSIFVTFGGEYYDYHAAMWGLASGLYGIYAMVINILELHDIWLKRDWKKPLFVNAVIGAIGVLAGTTAFVVYITIGTYNKEDLIIYGNSNWMGAVWAFMTVKWAAMTAVYSWWYYNRVKRGGDRDDENPVLNVAPGSYNHF